METSKTESNIPKTIWILWLQGFKNAPEIVKNCVATWERANARWRVIKIDKDSLKEYVSIEKILDSMKKT
jgi:mannosyltransferase OCH1-like enzyme